MKRKLTALLLAMVMLFPFALAGCGKKEDVAVTWNGLSANGTTNVTTTTELTLNFSKDPTTLAASNITVTGATKGDLSGTGTTRNLAISNITVNDGEPITVAVTSPGGFVISGSPRTVIVYKAAVPSGPVETTWTLTANGTPNLVTTTSLTLTFSKGVALTVGDITVTCATKGSLTGSGKVWNLAVSDITVENGQNVTVEISALTGHTISTLSKTVAISKELIITSGDGSDFDKARVLSLDIAEEVTADTYFVFIAPESGRYEFYSFDCVLCDPYVFLYDSNEQDLGHNDDADNDCNFSIFRNLQAGELIYMLATTAADDFFSESYYVTVEKNNGGGDISDIFDTADDFYTHIDYTYGEEFSVWVWNDNKVTDLIAAFDSVGFSCVDVTGGVTPIRLFMSDMGYNTSTMTDDQVYTAFAYEVFDIDARVRGTYFISPTDNMSGESTIIYCDGEGNVQVCALLLQGTERFFDFSIAADIFDDTDGKVWMWFSNVFAELCAYIEDELGYRYNGSIEMDDKGGPYISTMVIDAYGDGEYLSVQFSDGTGKLFIVSYVIDGDRPIPSFFGFEHLPFDFMDFGDLASWVWVGDLFDEICFYIERDLTEYTFSMSSTDVDESGAPFAFTTVSMTSDSITVTLCDGLGGITETIFTRS